MNIREFEGKKYIEFDKHKYQRKRLIISVIFLILLAGAVVALISAITTLQENAEVIVKDPLIYGMDVHNFTSCQCFDVEGKDWYSDGIGFKRQEAISDFIFEVPNGTE